MPNAGRRVRVPLGTRRETCGCKSGGGGCAAEHAGRYRIMTPDADEPAWFIRVRSTSLFVGDTSGGRAVNEGGGRGDQRGRRFVQKGIHGLPSNFHQVHVEAG